MPRSKWILILFALALVSLQAVADDELVTTPEVSQDAGTVSLEDGPAADEPATTVWYEYPDWLPSVLASERRDVATRFGWWYVDQTGDKNKVGEWQSLDNSPFLDIDALFSDSNQTLDFSASALDNDTTSGRLNFYSPKTTAKVEFDRYLHRLDHDPLYGTPRDGPIGAGDNVITEDLNVGEDYAIRVQELKTTVKGNLSENLEWRINLWGMRKTGERQVNAVGHCFDLDPAPGSQTNTCHVLSQRQKIDWLTMEIEPVIAAKFDNATVEYSRTMRSFGQDDQVVDRTYTRFGYSPSNGEGGAPFEYAIVPESLTQIDRLKMTARLSENNELYAYMYNGNTENEYRDTKRTFNGFDVRVTNRSIDNVSLTSYVKMTNEDNELPPFLLPQETEGALRHPVDYSRTRVGVKGRWKPLYDPSDCCSDCCSPWNDLALTFGYEYYYLGRDHAMYSSARLGDFTQPDTKRHEFFCGAATPWTQSLDSFIRYKARFTEDPLIGIRESTGRFNTNQPEQEHGIDIGGTWNPAPNFLATAQFSIVNRWNHSSYPSATAGNQPIRFTEDDYPIVCTVWYAPTDALSFTTGYAYFSNWIDQEITTGFRNDPIETSSWDYSGENHVVNLGTRYAWSPRLTFTGGCDWNSGSNSFSVPASTTGADWSQLASFSEVAVETMRYNTGVDYLWRDGVTLYFRYNYFDFEDDTKDYNSGTSHFLLAGASATY
jgi:hypothetical protein